MNKTILLAATAALAFTTGSALAGTHPGLFVKPSNPVVIHHPAGVLYNQNSNFGYGIDSQNFTSGSFGTNYNSAAADDFVVPGGHKWKVTGLTVTGVYFNGAGPASSEVVTFYKSKKSGLPGAIAARGTASYTLNCTDTAGSFQCKIPGPKGHGLGLSGGTSSKDYFVSIVANCSFVGGCGEWGWVQNNTDHNNPGVWENPANGFATGCTTWTPTNTCIGLGTDDFAFEIDGTSN